VLVLTDQDTLVLLAIAAFALGSAETLFDNAAQSLLPSVVDRDGLEVANGRLYAAEVVSNQFVGPPLGALLFAAAAAAPFLLDASSFGIAALVVLGLRGSFRPDRPVAVGESRPSIRADIAEGLSWLRHHELLRTVALALGVINMLETGVLAVFVLYSLEVLGLSQTGYGVLLTTGGIGGLAGSFLARKVSAKVGAGTFMIVATLGFGASMLVPGLWANPIAVGASMVVFGALGVGWNVVTVSLRQSIVPDELLGRVNGTYRLLGLGLMPVGAVLGGVLARTFGLRAPSIVGGVTIMIVGVVMIPWVNNRKVAEARAAATR
jgi:predicted MFS family arabinose efflux permease